MLAPYGSFFPWGLAGSTPLAAASRRENTLSREIEKFRIAPVDMVESALFVGMVYKQIRTSFACGHPAMMQKDSDSHAIHSNTIKCIKA